MTRFKNPRILFLVLAMVAMATPAIAQVPQLINYQGRLTDSGGDPVPNAQYSIVFTIYDNTSTIIWRETHASVTTSDGLFTVLLGAGDHSGYGDLDESIFSDSIRWLGIKVGGDPEISPRTRFTSVPYAHQSMAGGGWVDSGSVVKLLDEDDRIGIGTNEPELKVDIRGGVFISDSLIIQSSQTASKGIVPYPPGPARRIYPGEANITDSLGRIRTAVSGTGFRIVSAEGDDKAIIDSLGNALVQNLTVNGISTHYGDETYYGESFHYGHETYYDGITLVGAEGVGSTTFDPYSGFKVLNEDGVPVSSWGLGGDIIVNSFKMPDADVGSGYVLTSDAQGNGTWQAPSSGTSKVSCAGTENLTVDNESKVRITFPITFNDAGSIDLSTSAVVTTAATGQGYSARVANLEVTTTYGDVTLECWDGSSYVPLAQDDIVQISYTAIER